MEQTTQQQAPPTPFHFSILVWIEIFFIIIVFGLFLANYFHLVKLGNNTQQTKQLAPPSTWRIPTGTYTYTSDFATASLVSYIKTHLKPQFIPSKINVVHKLSTLGTQNDTDYTYGARWTQNSDTFYAVYHFNESSNDERNMQILINHLNLDSTSPQNAINKYINSENLSKLNCLQIPSVQNQSLTVCESFYTDNNGIKHGVGIFSGNVTTNSTLPQTNIFSCEIPPKSIDNNWKSCLQQFAQQGV